MSEQINLESIVRAAVKRASEHHWRDMSREDMSQEAWLWIYEHPNRVEREDVDTELLAYGLIREVGSHVGAIAQKERAHRLGYEASDQYAYGRAQIALALPAVVSGTTEPPAWAQQEIAQRTDPSEGGNWLALLADMTRAWEKSGLTEQQRELLTDYYCEDMTQEEIADMLNVTHQTVSNRLKAATRKLIDYLGGPAPQDLDEEWIETRLRERPGARRPIGPYAEITG